MVLIGIDTGTNTGLAIMDQETGAYLSIETVPIHKALETVLWYWEKGAQILLRFEDARLRKWVPYSGDIKAEKGRAQGAGYVKAHCSIWEDFCKDHRIQFEAVAPKNNATKLSAESFALLTGWKGRTTEHGRDAAMLLFRDFKSTKRNEMANKKK